MVSFVALGFWTHAFVHLKLRKETSAALASCLLTRIGKLGSKKEVRREIDDLFVVPAPHAAVLLHRDESLSNIINNMFVTGII